MDVDVGRDTAALDALSADWTRLDAADPGAEFYTRFPVVRAWWAAFGEDAAYDLEVVVARHNGAVVGILPLARQRISVRRQPRTQLRFASHGDWMGAILDPSLNPRTVCRALLAALDADPSWDILSLDNLRAGSALAATALATDRWNPHLTHRVEHPWIDLAGVAGLAAFEAAGRVPDKTRKYRGRLLRDHDVRFVVRAGDDVDMLDRLGRLHQREKDHLIADQGRTERHSWFESAQRLAHYRGIFATPGAVVTFGYERPDGELVAARSAFRHGRTLLSWTSTYHPDLRDYRLGKVLQYDILGHVLAAGEVDVFDFGAGRYPWKFEWTDRFTSSYRLRVEREVASASPTPPASPPTPVATPTSPLTTAATKEPATTPAAAPPRRAHRSLPRQHRPTRAGGRRSLVCRPARRRTHRLWPAPRIAPPRPAAGPPVLRRDRAPTRGRQRRSPRPAQPQQPRRRSRGGADRGGRGARRHARAHHRRPDPSPIPQLPPTPGAAGHGRVSRCETPHSARRCTGARRTDPNRSAPPGRRRRDHTGPRSRHHDGTRADRVGRGRGIPTLGSGQRPVCRAPRQRFPPPRRAWRGAGQPIVTG